MISINQMQLIAFKMLINIGFSNFIRHVKSIEISMTWHKVGTTIYKTISIYLQI